jgi:hypothetical protein
MATPHGERPFAKRAVPRDSMSQPTQGFPRDVYTARHCASAAHLASSAYSIGTARNVVGDDLLSGKSAQKERPRFAAPLRPRKLRVADSPKAGCVLPCKGNKCNVVGEARSPLTGPPRCRTFTFGRLASVVRIVAARPADRGRRADFSLPCFAPAHWLPPLLVRDRGPNGSSRKRASASGGATQQWLPPRELRDGRPIRRRCRTRSSLASWPKPRPSVLGSTRCPTARLGASPLNRHPLRRQSPKWERARSDLAARATGCG